jgi:hypothetical protein
MPDWPRPYHPINADGDPDTDTVVELFQHTVATTDELTAWCGGETAFVNGGPVVIVGGTRRAVDRLCGLGDYAVRDGDRWWATPADGLYQRYRPVSE